MLQNLIAGRARTLMFTVVMAELVLVLPMAAQESTVLDLPDLDKPEPKPPAAKKVVFLRGY